MTPKVGNPESYAHSCLDERGLRRVVPAVILRLVWNILMVLPRGWDGSFMVVFVREGACGLNQAEAGH
jgi:hypothetical protein